MNNPRISAVAALSENRVIGKGNQLPWHIPEDLKHFKKITSGHPVIMGRKTFESIGRLLPNRLNIIVTRDHLYKVEAATIAYSLNQAIQIASNYDNDEIFIIGGGQIFQEAMQYMDRLYLTVVHTTIEGDAHFPDYSEFTKVMEKEEGESNGYCYTFLTLER